METPQIKYYHNKTENDIMKANQFINIYDMFKKYNYELPERYDNIYNMLKSINRKPPRVYLKKKNKNNCIVISRELNRITFEYFSIILY